MTQLDELTTEDLDLISYGLWARHEEDIEEHALQISLQKTAAALQSTADFHQSMEMVQFTMIQGLVDMAYSKGVAVKDRLERQGRLVANLEHEADGSEIYEEKVNREMWKLRQLEAQYWYWRQAWKAFHTQYNKTVSIMQSDGRYDFLDRQWEPAHVRYERSNKVRESRKHTASELAARAAARK